MVKEKCMLHGVEFDVVKVGKDRLHNMMCDTIRNVKILDECYKKPSYAKQYIYNMWCEWFMALDNDYRQTYFGINSYNTHMFTLKGCIESLVDDDSDCVLYITKTRHIMYVA